MKPLVVIAGIVFSLSFKASALEIVSSSAAGANDLTLVQGKIAAAVVVDSNDYPVVKLAAGLFADDVQRVTGLRPAITEKPGKESEMIIAGTLGHSSLIDELASSGKLKDAVKIKNQWEGTLLQLVDKPFPGVDRALIVAGSDRRGTAYGLMQLSEKIGVSPWYWWADVPVKHRDEIGIRLSKSETDAPAVKYRGFFINDEDWGIQPWAAKTFEKEFGNIGPKTYEKVFELMLRLRLNYIWPAMHGCTVEFGAMPENVALADKYAIVAGSSHCEPMLCNNVHWNQSEKGPWNYLTNHDAIHSYWEDNVKARSTEEAVWTLGIRGIHDAGMQPPPNDMPGKINLLTEVFRDQRALLNEYVTKQWGSISQCFVPYKEVLPIYDAGLAVPDDVTIVWVDDNFGYIRRLGAPQERKRSGGAGIYWHLSYYGAPHSYTWINTTAPALLWEELHKAWENDARKLWVINVGDIKPMEIGLSYFSRLAWNPEAVGPDSQPLFLRDFVRQNFGENLAEPVANELMEFYRLGTIHKPELMCRAWALSLSQEAAIELEKRYKELLQADEKISSIAPMQARDAYTELISFPTHVLCKAGLIFLADRKVQAGENTAADEMEITRLRGELEAEVENFNTKIAGGKWDHMMPGLVTGKDLTRWSSQVRWPWGEKATATSQPYQSARTWLDAASAERQSVNSKAHWVTVAGLGASGRAVTVKPANLQSTWKEDDAGAPTLEYEFQAKGGEAEALIDFMPTFRIYPGMKLCISVNIDDMPITVVEVPGSSGAENENGSVRSEAIQNNCARAHVPLQGLVPGKHIFKIHAMDPGVVIDKLSFE